LIADKRRKLTDSKEKKALQDKLEAGAISRQAYNIKILEGDRRLDDYYQGWIEFQRHENYYDTLIK
jgi:hypothetical protein